MCIRDRTASASARMDWFQNYDGRQLTWNGSEWLPSATQPIQRDEQMCIRDRHSTSSQFNPCLLDIGTSRLRLGVSGIRCARPRWPLAKLVWHRPIAADATPGHDRDFFGKPSPLRPLQKHLSLIHISRLRAVCVVADSSFRSDLRGADFAKIVP